MAITTQSNVLFTPLYIGVWFDTLFLGILLVQLHYWITHFRRTEKLWTTLLVTYIGLLSLANTGLSFAYGFQIFVTGISDDETASVLKWTFGLIVVLVLMIIPVEMFYAYRAYVLWGRKRWVLIVFGLLLTWFIVAIGVYSAQPSGKFEDALLGPRVVAAGCAIFVIDWTVSGLLVIGFMKCRKDLLTTDKILRRVIILTVEAQLLPSLLSLGTIIKASRSSRDTLYLLLVGAPKVWAMSCLAVLNMRRSLREELEAERVRRQNTLRNHYGQRDMETGLDTAGAVRSEPLAMSIVSNGQQQQQYQHPLSNLPSSDDKRNWIPFQLRSPTSLLAKHRSTEKKSTFQSHSTTTNPNPHVKVDITPVPEVHYTNPSGIQHQYSSAFIGSTAASSRRSSRPLTITHVQHEHEHEHEHEQDINSKEQTLEGWGTTFSLKEILADEKRSAV